jgi:DNA primase
MTVKDPKLAFLSANLDIPGMIGSWFPDWNPSIGGSLVVCPFHNDTKGSLNISEDGRAYCHGCGWKARNIADLFAKMEGFPYTRARDMLMASAIDAVPDEQIRAFERCLAKNTKAMRYLLEKRNLSEEIISAFRLGYDPHDKRIAIPILDQFGYCRNIRRMGWLKEHKSKALNLKGRGETRLFPEHKIILERRLLLVEGEFDCLVGRAFGLPAVTWTGGAGSWSEEHEHFFKGKYVMVWYDNDSPGHTGANSAKDQLLGLALHTYKVVWPRGTKSGRDMTDVSLEKPGRLAFVRDQIASFKFPPRSAVVRTCPCCGGEVDKKGRAKKR